MSFFPPPADEFPAISTYCVPPCGPRREAIDLRLMQWARRYKAWVFPDCRDRVNTPHARSLIARYGGETHHGEPVLYYAHDGSCPWCGRALPAPPDERDEGEGPE